MISRLIVVFGVIFFNATLGFCNEHQHLEVAQHLLEKDDSSIIEYRDGRIYFHHDRLFFLPEGIFVGSDENELLSISNISFQNGDYYLAPSGYRCKRCGTMHPGSKPSSCSNCGGTSFSPYWDCRN